MIHIDKEVARRMEECIKRIHIEVTKLYPVGKVMEINGGAACFSGVDSYLSQVIGWGFNTKEKLLNSELNSIERFYKDLNHQRIDIEFCPYAGTFLAEFLSYRGYRITELNNISLFDLKTHHVSVPHVDIREVSPEEFDLWSKTIALGFGFIEAKTQFSYYIRAQGVRAFAAYIGGKIVAGGTIAIHETIGDLGVTSTLPSYRNMGLQKQLILARLNYAKNHGLELATMTTVPGTISDLNNQKSGFRTAYTRIKMTLEL